MEKVAVIYTIIKRADVNKVIELIRTHNPQAFYSVEDVKFVNKDIYSSLVPKTARRWRKGK
jgi:uncharacterized membrane-anchored protein YitT (DUF2179 family)